MAMRNAPALVLAFAAAAVGAPVLDPEAVAKLIVSIPRSAFAPKVAADVVRR
jgi:hypothetical protein